MCLHFYSHEYALLVYSTVLEHKQRRLCPQKWYTLSLALGVGYPLMIELFSISEL